MAFKFVSFLALMAMASAGYITDEHHYSPVTKVASYSSAPLVSQVYSSVGVQKEIFTPAYAPQVPVVHKSLSAYATPAIHKTVEYAAPVQSTYYAPSPVYAHEPHPQYAYDPHQQHHVHSHTQAYPIAAKTIEYAPAHVAKTIEYAPAHHIAKTIDYAPAHIAYAEPSYGHTHHSVHHGNHGTVSHYGKTISSPHSHVEKYDSRITNDHYKVAVPAVAVAPVLHHHLEHEPSYHHVPVAQYAHAAPILTKAAVAYSPAVAVAHASFQGPNAHYSW